MPVDVQAYRQYLTEWSAGSVRSRWDYDPPDHSIEDMIAMGDRYFSTVTDLLRHGDLIYVTDANNRRATLVVNFVDLDDRRVAWDIDATHSEQIILQPNQDYCIRHRGRGRYVIVDKEGRLVKNEIMSRDEAERMLSAVFKVPA